MADGKPFKVTGGEGSKKSAEEAPSPKPGVGILQSQKTGQPISTEALEGRAHGHSATIPWPKAVAIDEERESHKDGAAHKVSTEERKPFKV